MAESNTLGDLTVRILQDIRDDIRGTNQRLDETNQRLDETNRRLERMDTRLGRLEGRFDNLLEFAGDRYRDHEERISACERSIEELRR
jgi:chromosome segregation ATPase